MAFLVTTRIPGLPGETYDLVASELGEPLRQASGFVAHAAVGEADGVVVTELWDAYDDWKRFTLGKPFASMSLQAGDREGA